MGCNQLDDLFCFGLWSDGFGEDVFSYFFDIVQFGLMLAMLCVIVVVGLVVVGLARLRRFVIFWFARLG